MSQIRQIAEEVNIPNKILNIPPLTEMQAMPRSKVMAEFPQAQQERRILANVSWTRPQVARLQSGGKEGAGLWLKVIPSLPCFRSEPALFLAMFRTRVQGMWLEAERVVRCKCGVKAVGGGGYRPPPLHSRLLVEEQRCRAQGGYIGHTEDVYAIGGADTVGAARAGVGDRASPR